MLFQMSQSQQSDPHVFGTDDGYTLTRYIQAEARMYGALRFSYRPVNAVMRAKFRDNKRPNETEFQGLERVAAAAARRIVEWDAVDLKGNKLPVSAESVLALHPNLGQRLIAIVVWSFEGGDADPRDVPPDAGSDNQDPFGDNTDDSVVAQSRKNS